MEKGIVDTTLGFLLLCLGPVEALPGKWPEAEILLALIHLHERLLRNFGGIRWDFPDQKDERSVDATSFLLFRKSCLNHLASSVNINPFPKNQMPVGSSFL